MQGAEGESRVTDEEYRRAVRNTKITVALILIAAVIVAYILGRTAGG